MVRFSKKIKMYQPKNRERITHVELNIKLVCKLCNNSINFNGLIIPNNNTITDLIEDLIKIECSCLTIE